MATKTSAVETVVDATVDATEEIVATTGPVNLKLAAGITAGVLVLGAASFAIYKVRKNKRAAAVAEETVEA
jgi:hypothetical protein